ncbi:hypothetical protein L7F22_046278 [Adiantum nelumboides]|nr:hypothetical protein [Adiantum nelumboides]
MDEQRQRVQWEQQVAQTKMKAHHDIQIRKGKMKEGDIVLWYPGKLDARKKSLTVGWSEPYIIVRIFENGSVTLQDLRGMLLLDRVNRGKLKRQAKVPNCVFCFIAGTGVCRTEKCPVEKEQRSRSFCKQSARKYGLDDWSCSGTCMQYSRNAKEAYQCKLEGRALKIID